MKSILLIGMGKFGQTLGERFLSMGDEVMIVDKNEDIVNTLAPKYTNALIANCMNENNLRTMDIPSFDVCVVAIGDDFQSSLEITSILKDLGARYVVSKATTEIQRKFLLRNGADEVVNPEKQMAKWTAIRYSSDHILDYIELDDSLAIFEVSVPNSWIGKSIGQLDIRKKFNINILAVNENGKMNASVTPETVLTREKTMLVLGESKNLQKFFGI